MSLSEHKITGYADSIKELPDKIENNAAWLKAKFDGRTDKEVKEKHNGLVEALESTAAGASGAGGVGVSEIEGAAGADVQAVLESLRAAGREAEEALLLRVIAANDAVKYLRVNADRVLETSADGTNWQATGSSGHIVEDWTGAALPQRGRLRFAGMEVTDDPVSGTTEVQGLGVKLADRAPVPGVPLHCVLKPVGIAPPVPAEGRADGVTLAADAQSGVWRVVKAPAWTIGSFANPNGTLFSDYSFEYKYNKALGLLSISGGCTVLSQADYQVIFDINEIDPSLQPATIYFCGFVNCASYSGFVNLAASPQNHQLTYVPYNAWAADTGVNYPMTMRVSCTVCVEDWIQKGEM